MRIIKFGASNVANELVSLKPEELDALAFGVIELDESGKILKYNAAEGDITGRDPAAVIGRDFFHDVAPCTQGEVFQGRFKEGVMSGTLDTQFNYVFSDRMPASEVSVHMQKSEETNTFWVTVKRVNLAERHR